MPNQSVTWTSRSRKQDQFLGYQEYDRAQFYEHYHKLAEEFDEEFHKKHNEDLKTTLIFVSGARVWDFVITY